jgi:hypothetical protein
MTSHLWLWSAGSRCGLSDDEGRARGHAEEAALDGGHAALLELVVVGLGADLEPVYVHTDIAYKGTACGGRGVVAAGDFRRRRDPVAVAGVGARGRGSTWGVRADGRGAAGS